MRESPFFVPRDALLLVIDYGLLIIQGDRLEAGGGTVAGRWSLGG